MKETQGMHSVIKTLRKFIWRNEDNITMFKPTYIERNGFFPQELINGKWKIISKHYAEGAKKFYPIPKFVSDNISWMAKVEIIQK